MRHFKCSRQEQVSIFLIYEMCSIGLNMIKIMVEGKTYIFLYMEINFYDLVGQK
jgi:hypothetical protein